MPSEDDRCFVGRASLIASSRGKGGQGLLIKSFRSRFNKHLLNSKYVRDLYICSNGKFFILCQLLWNYNKVLNSPTVVFRFSWENILK